MELILVHMGRGGSKKTRVMAREVQREGWGWGRGDKRRSWKAMRAIKLLMKRASFVAEKPWESATWAAFLRTSSTTRGRWSLCCGWVRCHGNGVDFARRLQFQLQSSSSSSSASRLPQTACRKACLLLHSWGQTLSYHLRCFARKFDVWKPVHSCWQVSMAIVLCGRRVTQTFSRRFSIAVAPLLLPSSGARVFRVPNLVN